MTRMVRKQVYITPEQEKTLKRLAGELGVTEAEIIRESIDRTALSSERSQESAAWLEELAFMQERAKLKVPQTGRAWKREDLYDRWEQHHPR